MKACSVLVITGRNLYQNLVKPLPAILGCARNRVHIHDLFCCWTSSRFSGLENFV